jgi:hypothetical protein
MDPLQLFRTHAPRLGLRPEQEKRARQAGLYALAASARRVEFWRRVSEDGSGRTPLALRRVCQQVLAERGLAIQGAPEVEGVA